MTDPTAIKLLKDAENYLSALHGSVARHDNLAANYACAGCELRDAIRTALAAPAPAPVPADGQRRALARIRQMADAWEQQLPEVIRTPAVVSALRAALEGTGPVAVADAEQAATQGDGWLDAAAECNKAGGAYAERGVDAAASAAFALMETFLRKAGEAEYVAAPCDPMVPCEDGGEPCSTHERLMGHAEGDHELCAPDCGEPWLRRMADEEQPAEICRPFEVDGEVVSVRGSGEWTGQDAEFAAEVIRAAKRKYAAEHPDRDEAQPAAEARGCWCGHPEDRHWSGATHMTFPDGCHDCRGWNGAHAYGQELPWLPEGDAAVAQPDDYEATTGHLITCLRVAGGNPDPECPCATVARQDGAEA